VTIHVDEKKQDLCECCHQVRDRVPVLDTAAKLYGGFLCFECLVGYLHDRLEDVDKRLRLMEQRFAL
jgi:hypothetical protein